MNNEIATTAPSALQKCVEVDEDIDFPVNMARLHIMEATTRAMALNIFDEFGILPGPKARIDPLIVGRIKNPRAPKYHRDRVVSFIIAWHLDTRTL